MLFGKEQHEQNHPRTWTVERRGRKFHIVTTDGLSLDSFETKRAAIQATQSGFLVDLYHKETRWFAGESVPGWRPYAEAKTGNSQKPRDVEIVITTRGGCILGVNCTSAAKVTVIDCDDLKEEGRDCDEVIEAAIGDMPLVY
jgi:hypothetical protein